MPFRLRRALPPDVPQIECVMRESIAGISNRFYDPGQVAGALEYVAHLDAWLIEDGTYYVVESDGRLVACGGWSRRGKLYAGSGSADDDARQLDPASEPARVRAMFVLPEYARRGIGRMILDACEEDARAAGFRRAELMAMLSGHAMYRATGYRDVESVDAKLEDGTPFPLIRMEKAL
jgi:GNAT superfamily N-acetyltransferase